MYRISLKSACSFTVSLALSFAAYASTGSDYSWTTNPEVKKVRVVYRSVQKNIKRGKIKLFIRRFDDERCAVVVKEIGLSEKTRVRYFKISVVERGLTVTTEYYYDRNSKLRFVFIFYEKRKSEGDRVYYDEKENIIFAIEQKSNKHYVVSAKNTLYRKNSLLGGFIDENSALKDFRLESDCKEIQ